MNRVAYFGTRAECGNVMPNVIDSVLSRSLVKMAMLCAAHAFCGGGWDAVLCGARYHA